MKPSINDMLVFLSVVDARSFSGAAQQLGRTRSAISQAVTRLEEDVAARLLYRSTRSLTLTDAGARLAGRCRDIRRTYTDAVGDLQDLGEHLHGTITITAPHALCGSLLVPVLRDFMESNTDLDLRLIADDASVDLIEAQIDLAIRAGETDAQTARVTTVGTMSESLYASPAYVDGQGGIPDQPQQLVKWSHIANDWQGTPVAYRFGSGGTLSIHPRIRCNAFPQVIALAVASMGLARLPDAAADPHVGKGELVPVAALGTTPIYAVHQFGNRPPQKVRRFVDLLRAHLRRHHK